MRPGTPWPEVECVEYSVGFRDDVRVEFDAASVSLATPASTFAVRLPAGARVTRSPRLPEGWSRWGRPSTGSSPPNASASSACWPVSAGWSSSVWPSAAAN